MSAPSILAFLGREQRCLRTLKGAGTFAPDMQPRDLSGHTEYRAGRGIEEVARERGLDPDDLVKLASNENPYGPSPTAVEAIRDRADQVHVYPKTSHVDLTEALADHWNVSPVQIWLSPGGDGAIDYLSRAFLAPGETVLVPRPGFAYYSMSARYHHGTVREYRLRKDADFAFDPQTVLQAYEDERIVYLTTPHNPTGAWLERPEIEELASTLEPDTLLVVDEAYGEFCAAESASSLLKDYDNVAVVRTFSKAHGLAGLRLGYAVVPENWADVYAKVNTPFAANELACRAGLAALEDETHVDQTVETVQWAREYIRSSLEIQTWVSQGNFVLADVGDATTVSNELEAQGVIVRDCTSFGLPGCIRITCGTEADTKRAVEVIRDVTEK